MFAFTSAVSVDCASRTKSGASCIVISQNAVIILGSTYSHEYIKSLRKASDHISGKMKTFLALALYWTAVSYCLEDIQCLALYIDWGRSLNVLPIINSFFRFQPI